MNQQEFETLLADPTKQIHGNISWEEDEDHSPAVEFRVDVISQVRYPIFVKGSYNPIIQTLTYALIYRSVGRIYALDMGKEHQNPSGLRVGRKHKHRWSESMGDKDAYVPDDITALASDPLGVWIQFCEEAMIRHDGVMLPPPPLQLELF